MCVGWSWKNSTENRFVTGCAWGTMCRKDVWGYFLYPESIINTQRTAEGGHSLYTRRFTVFGRKFMLLGRCYGRHAFATASDANCREEEMSERQPPSARCGTKNETYLFPSGYPAS